MIVVLLALAAREWMIRRQERSLPSFGVELSRDRERELHDKVTKFTAAIQGNPSDFNAHVELALAKTGLGDREGAAEVYRQMNQRFPGNYLSFQNLGKLYEDAGKGELAAEQYLLAIKNAPKNPHMYRNLVELYTYHLTSHTADIPKVLQQGLAVIPGSIDLMSMLAVYYRDHGDLAEAVRWYEQLLVFDQQNHTALEELKELKAKLRAAPAR